MAKPKFRKGRKMSEEVSVGCLGMTIALILVIALRAFCTDYVAYTCWGKDLPTWADCCIGFVASGIVIPGAIVCAIVKACDVETPFWGDSTDKAPTQEPVTQPAI